MDADVIVIGAGMAGLAAAHELQKHGKRVLVLEARERIGGRLSTERFADGLLYERGGELIHGTTNALYRLVGELGIEIREQQHDAGGFSIGAGISLAFAGGLLRLGLHPEPGVDESMRDYINRLKLLPGSVRELLEEQSKDYESTDRVSALHMISRTRRQMLEGEVYGEHDFLIPGGYVQILDHLSRNLRLELGRIVEGITWDGDGVVVRTSDRSYSAARTVITLPVNVLKEMPFEPALPEIKMSALSAFTALDIVKLLVPVPLSSIRTDLDQGTIPTANIVPIWWRRNLPPVGPQQRQLFVGWITGPHARRFLALPPDEAIERALQELAPVFSADAINREEIIAQNWSEDEFARGPYHYVPPGFGLNVTDDLAAPLGGRLFFAGEATSQESASAHGAYESGLRVAEEIQAVSA